MPEYIYKINIFLYSFLFLFCLAPFSYRNLSTAIFLTLYNFWLFDRKHFSQTFRLYIQRIARWAFTHLSNLHCIQTLLPMAATATASVSSLLSLSLSSITIRVANRLISLPSNLIIVHRTIFRSIATRILQKIHFTAFTSHSLYHCIDYPIFNRHQHHHQHHHYYFSYLLSNLIFATRLMCTSINCSVVP